MLFSTLSPALLVFLYCFQNPLLPFPQPSGFATRRGDGRGFDIRNDYNQKFVKLQSLRLEFDHFVFSLLSWRPTLAISRVTSRDVERIVSNENKTHFFFDGTVIAHDIDKTRRACDIARRVTIFLFRSACFSLENDLHLLDKNEMLLCIIFISISCCKLSATSVKSYL